MTTKEKKEMQRQWLLMDEVELIQDESRDEALRIWRRRDLSFAEKTRTIKRIMARRRRLLEEIGFR